MKRVTLIELVAAVGLLAFISCSGSSDDGSDVNSDSSSAVKSYDDCVAAGYPIMESFPPQCTTPDGTVYVDNPEEPITGENPLCEDRCGDGECQETVCLAEGCPCAESEDTCKKDCA